MRRFRAWEAACHPNCHKMQSIFGITEGEIFPLDEAFQGRQLTIYRCMLSLSAGHDFQGWIDKIQVEGTVTSEIGNLATQNGKNGFRRSVINFRRCLHLGT